MFSENLLVFAKASCSKTILENCLLILLLDVSHRILIWKILGQKFYSHAARDFSEDLFKSEQYSEPSKTSKREQFMKISNSFYIFKRVLNTPL